ncbi:MAG: hypothetical protein AB7K09_15310 [Planctomycetota bacterium]
MQLTHHYPARRLPDGTFEIRELDIFAECSRLNPHTGDVDVFDADWLQAATDRAVQRAQGGYLAPVHLGHHDPAREDEPPFAGFLRDLRVDRDSTPARLRATITAIPPDVFSRIRESRIPYRSVEIHLPGEPEIASLALLESTVPFFRFPVTRVNETADDTVDAPLAFAFAESGEHLHCVASFEGGADLARTARVALERVHATLDDLQAEPEPDTNTGADWSEADLQRELNALAAGGFVFRESLVRQLAQRATQLPVLFAALRELLPLAPVSSSAPSASPSSPRNEAHREIARIVRELGLPDDAARMAEAAAIEFASLEPRFRALGCSFGREDYIRSRLAPVSTTTH